MNFKKGGAVDRTVKGGVSDSGEQVLESISIDTHCQGSDTDNRAA